MENGESKQMRDDMMMMAAMSGVVVVVVVVEAGSREFSELLSFIITRGKNRL